MGNSAAFVFVSENNVLEVSNHMKQGETFSTLLLCHSSAIDWPLLCRDCSAASGIGCEFLVMGYFICQNCITGVPGVL